MSSSLKIYFNGQTTLPNNRDINSVHLALSEEIEAKIPSNRHSFHFRHLTFGYQGNRCDTLPISMEKIQSIASIQIGIYEKNSQRMIERQDIAITQRILQWKTNDTYRIDIEVKTPEESHLPPSITATLKKDFPKEQEEVAKAIMEPLSSLFAHIFTQFAEKLSQDQRLNSAPICCVSNMQNPLWFQMAVSKTILEMSEPQIKAIALKSTEDTDQLQKEFEKALQFNGEIDFNERIDTLTKAIMTKEIHHVKKLGSVIGESGIETIARRYFYSVFLDPMPSALVDLIEEASREFAIAYAQS